MTQQGEKAVRFAASDLFAHHVDPFGIADPGGLGDGIDIVFPLLIQQAHPEPTPDLPAEGGHDSQGRFIGRQQDIHQGHRFGGSTRQERITHLQRIGGLAANQGFDRLSGDDLPGSDIEGEFLQLAGQPGAIAADGIAQGLGCLLYTSPSPRDRTRSRMPSSA